MNLRPVPPGKVCAACGEPIRLGQRWKWKVNTEDSLRIVDMSFHLLCFAPDSALVLDRGQRL